MAPELDAAEVARHNTPESCWVILYGKVYDVTSFLSSHPGGSRIILSLAGQDATEDYDPVHPPGTLEENLAPEAVLGTVSAESQEKLNAASSTSSSSSSAPPATAATPSPPSPAAAKSEPEPLLPVETLLSLDDIEKEAAKRISPRAWAYYFSASDDQISKVRNNEVYRAISMRQRVLVNVRANDQSTSFLGHAVSTPVFVAPAAMARLAHPDGEAGIARAAARFGAMTVVSNNASMTPEQIVEGAPAGQLFGWQVYVQDARDKTAAMLRRVNALREHYKFICLTLDAPTPGKRELDERGNLGRAGGVRVAAAGNPGVEARPGGGGVGQQLFHGTAADLTWAETLPWLAAHTDLPIVLKGVQAHEDAYLAMRCHPQVKAIILSNHGGRACDTAPPPLHTLLEIRKYCPEVLTRLEVWIDGGIRRGTDVVKALCLGARGVGVGRAPLYGLGAGGQAGVERMFEILQAEIATAMRLIGARSIPELRPSALLIVDACTDLSLLDRSPTPTSPQISGDPPYHETRDYYKVRLACTWLTLPPPLLSSILDV
ncbi:L-lactate ferricytochrome c oxidoreductase [Cordyceps fumosorosea ARSEF 2679]|uniref:L-lactate dehydrogenase (cytochrome) n=1 Tax=Cordyceps fumosorosea (strain ARSEF 2679) TaxID=1081104 RepID=A0A168E8Q0_CORFA|nr:L-lactate ferricytochrome c oxidoreductase [Cordyceps fumosorosea ARSEF 2679]OAA73508.1 L-lactate ferricytochrome c oxidoreductase [Cordyceps fumosorosea ARSEF 2679]